MSRVLVQFDGSNFYNKVKKMDRQIHLSSFRYKDFCKKLVGQKDFLAYYYVGEIKKKEGDPTFRLYTGQQALLRKLRSNDINIKLGYLLHSKGKYQEKGVDVQIAVDMVDFAADDMYDTCYLLSSDTDLIPAIRASQKRGKKIIYVGFEGNLSIALRRVCSETVILNRTFFYQ